MRTRRATYPPSSACGSLSSPLPCHSHKRLLQHTPNDVYSKSSKKSRTPYRSTMNFNGFDVLHDDLVLSVLICVGRCGTRPVDLVNTMLTCKRFLAMGMHPLLLTNVNASALAVKAVRWSEGSHRFLKRCADAGNVEACYTLGMIRFYCLRNTVAGASLMAKAAMSSHAGALHSLAVIQFNGSGGGRRDKDLKAGVALCARAASLGHVDAMRELGHCLQDGYGVVRNVLEGRRLLLEANAREAAAAVASSPRALMEMALHLKMSASLCLHHLCLHHLQCYSPLQKVEPAQKPAAAGGSLHHTVYRLLQRGGCSLLSDFGCNVPPAEVHIANKFLIDWFDLHPPPVGLRLCSHANCGRPETRRHEFRRCSVCGKVNYCSRACQAMDWKIRHKYHCQHLMGWDDRDDNNHEDAAGIDEEENAAAEEDFDHS